MKIAIIGGGFTGLSAAYDLLENGHSVTVFERESVLGGLAHGFKGKKWDWPLEFAYHHFFTNDKDLIRLMRQLGMEKDLLIKRPLTSTLIPAKDKILIRQLDSPLSLLMFDQLPFLDRIRTGLMLGTMKLWPFWQPLENYTAVQFFKMTGGEKSWSRIWEPLLYGKFGDFAPDIAASWLWARIKKRTTNLGYIGGGFQNLINTLAASIKNKGGRIFTDSEVKVINPDDNGIIKVKYAPRQPMAQSHELNETSTKFDRLLMTAPSPIAVKLLPQLNRPTKKSGKNFLTIPHLHAQLLVLETEKPVLDNIYWLNINDRSFPFLAFVQHTNLIDRKYYNGHHISYIGNYLPEGHRFLKSDKDTLLKKFGPYLTKINPRFDLRTHLVDSYLFIGRYAQPVHQKNYSRTAPRFETPYPNIYLANMDSIYPWDRGTNYAIELGRRAAKKINSTA